MLHRQFEATTSQTVEGEYRCRFCGFSSNVQVEGIGKGRASSFLMLFGERSREMARDRAEGNIDTNVKLTLQLCPCPRCGKRDSRRFVIESASLLVGSALLVWAIGALFSWLDGQSETWLLAFGVMGLVAPVLVFFRSVKWRWTTAADRVRFQVRDARNESPPA